MLIAMESTSAEDFVTTAPPNDTKGMPTTAQTGNIGEHSGGSFVSKLSVKVDCETLYQIKKINNVRPRYTILM